MKRILGSTVLAALLWAAAPVHAQFGNILRQLPGNLPIPGNILAPAAPAPAEEATDPGLDLLSAREREVMQLLARGYTYREIGSRLFISVKTVESHASNVLRKLQLSNRNELTRWAATNRLL